MCYKEFVSNSKFWPYLKVLIALPFVLGIGLSVTAFLPVTDDFGNPVDISIASQLLQFFIGLALFTFAIYLTLPSIFERRKSYK